MTDLVKPRFQVRVAGEYSDERFESYSLTSDFTTPCDAWDFTVGRPEDPASLRRFYQPLMPIEIYIDDRLQLVGRIDATEDSGASSLRVKGRNFIADLSDPNVDPGIAIKADDTLSSALERIFAPWGVTVTSDGNDSLRNVQTGATTRGGAARRDLEQQSVKKLKLEPLKPEYGEGAFQFANGIVARHGLTIQAGRERYTLALCSPNYDQEPLYTLKFGVGGNIIDRSASRDWSQVPTVSTLICDGATKGRKVRDEVQLPSLGQASPNSLGEVPEIYRIIERANVYDEVVKTGDRAPAGSLYRPVFFRDDKSRNLEQLRAAAYRMLSERILSTLTYSCTVVGHTDRDTGLTYAVDTMAYVADDVSDVFEPMWIKARTFRMDSGGARTELELIRQGSYVL